MFRSYLPTLANPTEASALHSPQEHGSALPSPQESDWKKYAFWSSAVLTCVLGCTRWKLLGTYERNPSEYL